jgi:Skp family chaperone for outer membrane proteins
MKRSILLGLSLVFVSMLAASASAQVPAQPGAGKIGWINMAAFDDDKEGIKKLVNAGNQIDLEFKPRILELQTIATRINTIKDELSKMGSNPAVPVNQQAVATKQEEASRLQREGEFKQKELQAAIEKRKEVVVGPIMDDIGKAMDEFAKQKGYTVILDPAKLFQAGVLLSFDRSADMTKDFVTFYNARPTTATTGAATPARP